MNSNQHISKLALGTAQFGLAYGVSNASGQVSFEETMGILSAAREIGIDTVDTAVAYGDSERILGRVGMSDWSVISKLPAMPLGVTDVATWVEGQLHASMGRLGISQLDGLLLHRPEQLLGPYGAPLWSAIEDLRREGIVNKIGVSVYSYNELPALLSGRNIDLVQAPLNILDRSLVDSGWASRLNNQGIELHVRSAFLQGLLLMEKERPERFSHWQPLWSQWQEWLLEHQLTPVQACLRYCLSVPEVDRVVVGVESALQLSEIISAAIGLMPQPPAWCMPIDEVLSNPAKWSQL